MKRHALFVGVNSYDDKSIRPLRYSVPDASVLADRFETLGFHSRLLSDPTSAQMKGAVEEMVAGLGPGDVFLFFFSGHGFTAQDGAHLLFCRDDRQKLLRVNGAGTRVDSLEMLAEGPFHRAFLLDSCRSDALAGLSEKGGATTKDLDFVAIAPSTGSTFILRSCNKFLPSLEIERLGHGLFTRGLLDAINCRDAGLARCGDAFADSVRVHMDERAKEVGAGFGQCPCIQLDGPVFSLFDERFFAAGAEVGAKSAIVPTTPAPTAGDAPRQAKVREQLSTNAEPRLAHTKKQSASQIIWFLFKLWLGCAIFGFAIGCLIYGRDLPRRLFRAVIDQVRPTPADPVTEQVSSTAPTIPDDISAETYRDLSKATQLANEAWQNGNHAEAYRILASASQTTGVAVGGAVIMPASSPVSMPPLAKEDVSKEFAGIQSSRLWVGNAIPVAKKAIAREAMGTGESDILVLFDNSSASDASEGFALTAIGIHYRNSPHGRFGRNIGGFCPGFIPWGDTWPNETVFAQSVLLVSGHMIECSDSALDEAARKKVLAAIEALSAKWHRGVPVQ